MPEFLLLKRALVFVLLIASGSALAQQPEAGFSLSKTEINFGDVRIGDMVKDSIILQNISSDTLTNLNGPEYLFEYIFPFRKLPPGHSITIPLYWFPHGESGLVEDSVFIFSLKQMTKIYFRANILPHSYDIKTIHGWAYVPETTYDFGKVKQGDYVKSEYALINISNQVQKIRVVKSSCGCYAPYFTKDEIAPGDTAWVGGYFNTSRVGAVNKNLTVFMEHGSQPFVLYLKGEVLKPDPAPVTSDKGIVPSEKRH